MYDATTDLDPNVQSMHSKMRQLALKRQKRSSFAQKAAWALYDEKHFRRLIEDVTSLVDSLIELFPAIRAPQQQLCLEEATEMEAEPSLEALGDAAEDVDELLHSSVQQFIAGRIGHMSTKNLATDEARVRYGDEVAVGASEGRAGYVYNGNTASGRLRAQYGNKYGGKVVLDDE